MTKTVCMEKGDFLSTDGHSRIAYRLYTPEGFDPIGVVQISHGMSEHIARYDEFARYLCEQGYAVCGNDHLGHGESAPALDALGYFAPENGWDFLVRDLKGLTEIMKERFPELPYFLLGHSMGSFLARMYLTRYGDELSGAMISGTTGPNPGASAGSALAKLIQKKKGGRFRSSMIDRLAFGTYNARCSEKRTKFDWLSREQSVVDDYIEDPYCGFLFTVSAFIDLFSLIGMISQKEWARAVPKRLPILLMSGDQDPVGEYGKGIRVVYKRLVEQNCSVRMKLYPGGRHEMLNETNRQQVYQDVLRFLTSLK